MRSFLVILFCCSVPWLAFNQQWDLSGGTELGWWLHDLGTTDPAFANNLGRNKTNFSGAFYLEAGYLFGKQKFRAGPFVHGNFLIEDDLRAPGDAPGNRQRITISEGRGVPSLRFGAQMEYRLLDRGPYVFAPGIRYGSFQVWTAYEEKERFGYRHFIELVCNHIWKFKDWEMIFRMKFVRQRIFLQQPRQMNETFRVFSWGLGLGVRV